MSLFLGRGNRRLMFLQKGGMHLASGKGVGVQHRTKILSIVLYTLDLQIRQCGRQPAHGLCARWRPGNNFAEQAVVVDADAITGAETCINTQLSARCPRPGQVFNQPGTGQKVGCRAFRIDTRFNGPAITRDIILSQRQRFAARHPQLPLHQIQPGDGLGDRMFHLQAGIHFQKIKLFVLIQKLNRTSAGIPNGLRRAHSGLTHGHAYIGF